MVATGLPTKPLMLSSQSRELIVAATTLSRLQFSRKIVKLCKKVREIRTKIFSQKFPFAGNPTENFNVHELSKHVLVKHDKTCPLIDKP